MAWGALSIRVHKQKHDRIRREMFPADSQPVLSIHEASPCHSARNEATHAEASNTS